MISIWKEIQAFTWEELSDEAKEYALEQQRRDYLESGFFNHDLQDRMEEWVKINAPTMELVAYETYGRTYVQLGGHFPVTVKEQQQRKASGLADMDYLPVTTRSLDGRFNPRAPMDRVTEWEIWDAYSDTDVTDWDGEEAASREPLNRLEELEHAAVIYLYDLETWLLSDDYLADVICNSSEYFTEYGAALADTDTLVDTH